jgi:hypothetical protein
MVDRGQHFGGTLHHQGRRKIEKTTRIEDV